MTDHPMSCYPGHFEVWRPGEKLLGNHVEIPDDQWSDHYDGLGKARASDISEATDKAIYRMMGKEPQT